MPDAQTQIGTAVSTIPSTGDSGNDSLIARLQRSEQEVTKHGDEVEKKIGSYQPPEPPKLDNGPDPKDFDRSPLEAFGSTASVLASLASLTTRHAFTTALNSTAGVMNAYKAQDGAAFNKAFDKWKVDSDNAIKMANYRQDIYKDLLDRDESAWRVYAAAHKDETAKLALESRDRLAAVRAAKSQAAALEKPTAMMRKAADDAGIKYDKEAKEKGVWTQEGHDSAVREGWGKAAYQLKGDEAKKEDNSKEINWDEMKPQQVVPGTGMSFATIKANAKAIANGVPPSRLGLGYSMNPAKKAVENYMNFAYPDVDLAKVEAEYGGEQQGLRSLQTRSAMVVASAEELDELIPAAKDAIKDYKPGTFKSLNELSNAANTQLNDPQLAAMNTAIQGVATAYNAMLVRNGVPTDQSRAKTDTLINNSMATGNFDSTFKQMNIEKDKILTGLDKAKKDLTEGGSSSAELKKYTPEEYKAAKKEGKLKKGDRFLSADGVPHEVQ